MGTQLNTQPIFTAEINKAYVRMTNQVSTPNHGTDQLVQIFEAGQNGSLIESIQIHYLNWGASEPANSMFFYVNQANFNLSSALCIGQTVIAANANTSQLPAPINVSMPSILYGESKTALKMAPGETLWAALETASTAGFNVVVIGGDF